ncbi:MAG: lipopolysaccharide heptosyltransferase II [Verrucomicrobiae bacterium]|nr:lipopolysaccharide heptosyltransferase II [Verrucomicrobiae bacterium]
MQPRNILIYGLNWLGDSIMAMPALRHFIDEHPADRVAMLARRGLEPLWAMFPGLRPILPLGDGLRAIWQAVSRLRSDRWDAAYLLPHSTQSAIVPLCAGIPNRIGAKDHECPFLLTRVVPLPPDPRHHQAHEYFNVLGLPATQLPPPPAPLEIPPPARQAALDRLGEPGPWVGLIPGAARGPSKRWPPSHFIAVGRRLAVEAGARCLIFGTREESSLCAAVSEGIGACAQSLAGQTSLPELAALLGLCHVVVTNDCGGMHLAAAAGATVVAVFGLTDPRRTGPLGEGHRIVSAEGVSPSRDVGRRCARARRAMESISPDRVSLAALAVLREDSAGSRHATAGKAHPRAGNVTA